MSAISDTPSAGPEPTAITPNRVLVLTEAEQHYIVTFLHGLLHDDGALPGFDRFVQRVEYGTDYDGPLDELVRLTQDKRAVEAHLRKLNARISDLDELVVEDLQADGLSKVGHAATGATVSITQKVWAKVVREGDKVTDAEKDAAAAALEQAGLGAFVQRGFNSNTVSAWARERFKEWQDAQAELPEALRQVLDINELLPEAMREHFRLTNTPTTSVRIPAGA